MFTSQISTICPFTTPNLSWCEIAFDHEDAHELSHQDENLGLVQIALPAHLARAVPKRKSEFLAGRACAAFALRQLAYPEDVPIQGNRSPHWPNGIAGSISHTGNRAIAVVSSHFEAVGVDCEQIMQKDQANKIRSMILTDDEAHLRPANLPFEVFLTLVFSAKEAFYKSISKDVGRILDFHEVVLISVTDRILSFSFSGKIANASWLLGNGDCVTLVALPLAADFRQK